MAAPANNGQISPPNTALIDERGNITPPWYRYLVQRQRVQDGVGNATVLTIDDEQSLFPNSRALAVASGELTETTGLTDVTLGLADSGVTAATYGAATKLVVLAIDAKGRVTSASEITLNSDNVTEGVTNLFFTQARARASVSGTAPISYNVATGVFSLADSGVTAASYGGANKSTTVTFDAKGRATAASETTITIAAVSGGTPCADGVHTPVNSITTLNGIITAIS